jgi:hypothetical protein
VNPTQLDQLRDSLRRETEQLQPVGLGVEDVKRKGSHRRNRSRAFVAIATVTCLSGAGVALSQRPAGKHVVDISGPSSTPPPALAFRVVDGEIAFATHFTSADGVTYALSTAPGVASNPAQPGQAIYSTKDGAVWTVVDQGQPWISDLAAGNGVLYAIGTSPGAGANDIDYRVGTSTDGGHEWADTNLPFDASTPSATVTLSHSTSVQLARSDSETVALLTEQFSPDLDAIIAAREPGKNVSINQTADGFQMLDLGACIAAKQGVLGRLGSDGSAPATTTVPGDPRGVVEGNCKTPPVLGTITWSDIGMSSGADLIRQQILVSTDGTNWDHGTAPGTGFVSDLVASGDGFLLLADTGRTLEGSVPGMETTLMRSTDARTWTNVPMPTSLSVQAISGSRAIGVDGNGAIEASNDGGATWTATDAKAQLPSGSEAGTVMTVDAGPLGFAAVVNANSGNYGGAEHAYLLFSTDGVTWSTNDLADKGTPADSYPSQVIVGSDHVGVDFQGPVGPPNTPAKITTVLATPKR